VWAGVRTLTLLADTHIWRRWRAEPQELTRAQVRALRAAERKNEAVGVSAISLWELAMLAASGRIRMRQPLETWIHEMVDDPLIEVLPLTPAIAAGSVGLVGLHGDSADIS
jgi:PIN domain nuclease of toxin-antitoxin system